MNDGQVSPKAHCQNDPATPRSRPSDRTTETATPRCGTRAVIFDPGNQFIRLIYEPLIVWRPSNS
jgi:hypothetical protein